MVCIFQGKSRLFYSDMQAIAKELCFRAVKKTVFPFTGSSSGGEE